VSNYEIFNELIRYKTKEMKNNSFKKLDIHFRANKIDSFLADFLISTGLYYADFLDKKTEENEMYRVFTLQFEDAKQGIDCYNHLCKVVNWYGGFTGKIQIEPTIAYWRKGVYPVPPIV
jgi:hypothetical protein